MRLDETQLPLTIEGIVRISGPNLGTPKKKRGCFILKVDNRGCYVLMVQPKLGLNGEGKVKSMTSNNAYRVGEKMKLVVYFSGSEGKMAVLEDGKPEEVEHFRLCLDEAKNMKSAKNAIPAGRIVSQRPSVPTPALPRPLYTPAPIVTGLTPSKKRPRDRENQTQNKSLRQASNVRTTVKHPGQTTPAKGEQVSTKSHTPIRAPTPRPDNKHTPDRDSSLSRFRREHGTESVAESVERSKVTASNVPGAKYKDDTKENNHERSSAVPRKGNSDFLESAKKKFEAGDEKRKTSAISTNFYNNSALRDYTIPRRRPGFLPDPVPKKTRLAENYLGWSDKNKGLVKSQAQPSLQGFSNLGNTCYMNAILQALRGVETFSTDLINRDIIGSMDNTTLYRNIAILFHYCNKPAEKQNSERKQQFLKGVKTAVSSSAQRFSGYLQHDAHEFLSQCLDQLREDIKKVQAARTKDSSGRADEKEIPSDSPDAQSLPCPVTQNFQFEVIHTIQCKSCEDVVTKQEQFHDLSLHLPRRRKDLNPWSLQDLLDQFFIAEDIEYTCEQCGNKESRVSHKFTKLPRVLILHLKRYNYNSVMSENQKMEQPVFLPLYLTLQSHCTEETRPCLFPSLHPAAEKRTEATDQSKNPGLAAKKPSSFRPSKKCPKIQMMEASGDESGPSFVKKKPQTITEEDRDMQKALELSRQTAAAEKEKQDNSFTLDNVTEEEQYQMALEKSMLDIAPDDAMEPDEKLLPFCVRSPLKVQHNNQSGNTWVPAQTTTTKQPLETRLFSIVGDKKTINRTDAGDTGKPEIFDEEETFEIRYAEEPPTVGLCGGNDNPGYASPEQVKRRHSLDNGGSKLGSNKKRRLSSPGGGRAAKNLASNNGQRTLGKWLKQGCFTLDRKKEEINVLADDSTQNATAQSLTKQEEILTISDTDAEENRESGNAMETESSDEERGKRTTTEVVSREEEEPLKNSDNSSESEIEQNENQEVSPFKEWRTESDAADTVANSNVAEISAKEEIVAKVNGEEREDKEEKMDSTATNEGEVPSEVSSQRRDASNDNAADPNNNQDLNNNSEADVESESDKENQQPEEENEGQGSGQGSIPLPGPLTLPDWVTEHAQQGEQDYQQKEEEELRRALDQSLIEQREREEKEEEDVRKATELSLQDMNGSFELGQCADAPLDEEEMSMMEIARSVEEAEAIRTNAETGDLPYSFRLVSIVNHIGQKSSSGHYISDVYDMQKRTWLKWDDSQVERTSEKFVREKRQTSGYIFFYMNKDCFDEVAAMTAETSQVHTRSFQR